MKSNYKIKIWLRFSIIVILTGFSIDNVVVSQSNITNKYGLTVIKDTAILRQQIRLNPAMTMVDLGAYIPGLVLDLKYATTNNFMNETLYPPLHTTYLRLSAAEALKNIVKELKEKNLGIKIFDAYRPYSVTEKMWEKVKDDRYAADPAKGSGHNRGVSVDLTLINLETGTELLMPTGYDNFSDTAHLDFMDLTPEILQNRETLKTIMEKNGFIALETEWWHYYLPNSSNYELMDFPFSELDTMAGSESVE